MKLMLKKPLAFFDLETTGLNIVSDRIVEISILKVMPDGEEIVRTEKINPEMPIPAETSAIHGIYDKDVADKPNFATLANSLMQFIDNCDLAGFNSNKFDIPFLAEEFARAGLDFNLKNRNIIDVQNIFHKMEPRNLSAAYKFYCGKVLENAHSAEADTMATYEIFKAQIEKYEGVEHIDPKGNKSTPIVNDIEALSEFSTRIKFADLAGHFAFDDKGNEIFNFGKYKGQKLEDVFEKEPQYYDWMMKAQFPEYTKKIASEVIMRMLRPS
jgi:DNA polymerase-3 subunit epsilon